MISITTLSSTQNIAIFGQNSDVPQEILPYEYNMGLVVVSILICTLANYATLLIFDRRRALKALSARRTWSIFAIGTVSIGVWAMHFTGMLAYSIPSEVTFNATLTTLSFVPVAIGSTAAYLCSLAKIPRLYGIQLTAFCMCLGVAGMHFIGMKAMHVEGVNMQYRLPVIALSFFIAHCLAYSAIKFYLTTNQLLSANYVRLGTGVLMSMSFSSMHYIAMFAVKFSAPIGWQSQTLPPSSNLLAIAIFCITALIFFAVVAVSFMDAKISSYNSALVRSRNRLARSERLLLKAGEMTAIAGWEFTNGKINISNQLQTMIPELSPVDPLSFLKTVSSVELDSNQRAVLQVRNFDKRLTFPGDNGVRHYRSRCEQISPGQLFGCIQDITEQVQKELRLQDAKESAEIAVQTRSRFLANMSHELRTPLNGVLGMIPILKDTKLDSEQSEYLEIVQTSGESLLKVINEILDYTKLDHGQLQLESLPFDLESIVYDALTVVSASASNKRLDLELHWHEDTPCWYLGDATRIYQIVINILSNAVKFTEQGGVVISVKGHNSQQKENVEISISDDGIGIPEAQQERIFDSFHQADSSTTRKFGGTGLGLSITKSLLEQMSGTIQLHSVEGKGSTFLLNIPLPRASDHEKPISLERTNYALIIDNLNLRQDLEKLIINRGGSLVNYSATDMKPLIKTIHGFSGLIVDCDSTAYQTETSTLEKLSRKVPTVLLTRLRKQSQLSGATRIRRPFKPSQLAKELKNCIQPPKDTTTFNNKHIRSNSNARVLVAEDNLINQKIALSMLRKIGVEADCVKNGKDALDAFNAKTYDIVLMDMQMPVMDGIDATKEIRNQDSRQPYIIAVTANLSEEDQECCMENGMNEHIGKPIQLEKLEQSLVRGQQWISGQHQSH